MRLFIVLACIVAIASAYTPYPAPQPSSPQSDAPPPVPQPSSPQTNTPPPGPQPSSTQSDIPSSVSQPSSTQSDIPSSVSQPSSQSDIPSPVPQPSTQTTQTTQTVTPLPVPQPTSGNSAAAAGCNWDSCNGALVGTLGTCGSTIAFAASAFADAGATAPFAILSSFSCAGEAFFDVADCQPCFSVQPV